MHLIKGKGLGKSLIPLYAFIKFNLSPEKKCAAEPAAAKQNDGVCV